VTSPKPLLGTVASLTLAYPTVQSLRASVHHYGEVLHSWQRDEVYTEDTLPQVIRCLNARCQQGGFDLNATFITLAHERMTNHKANLYCHGHEGTPRGKRVGDQCSNRVQIEVQLKFKE
jgi:hypothetical protein